MHNIIVIIVIIILGILGIYDNSEAEIIEIHWMIPCANISEDMNKKIQTQYKNQCMNQVLKALGHGKNLKLKTISLKEKVDGSVTIYWCKPMPCESTIIVEFYKPIKMELKKIPTIIELVHRLEKKLQK